MNVHFLNCTASLKGHTTFSAQYLHYFEVFTFNKTRLVCYEERTCMEMLAILNVIIDMQQGVYNL